MFTRFTPLSLAFVFLFISLKTFSQVKNNQEKIGSNQLSVLNNPASHLQKKTARIFLANEMTSYRSNADNSNPVQNSFTECFKDDMASEFALGQLSEITISSKINGELSLKTLLPNEDFNDNNIPAGWEGSLWKTGGTTGFSGGIASVNGSRIYSTQTFLPNTSIEFSAKFTLGNFENIGFAKNGNFDSYWLAIGRGEVGSDPNLYVRTSEGVSVFLGSNLLNEYHNYRIIWGEASFTIYVDEVLTATIIKTFTTDLTLVISDYISDGRYLSVDWIRYGASHPAYGSYNSRVIPIGNSTAAIRFNWNATLAENTDIEIWVIAGNTPMRDNTWTYPTQVSNGEIINVSNSYLQYFVQFSSIGGMFTPVLNDISFSCSNEAVTLPVIPPPLISNITIQPNKDGSAKITWTTDRNSDSRIDYGTSPESLISSTTSNGYLSKEHFLFITGLTQGTTYYARVSSTDAELRTAISPLISDAPLSFTVPVYTPVCAKDDIFNDFEQAEIKDSTEAVNIINGELSLKPFSVDEQFHSTAIPEGWNAGTWKTGATTNFSHSTATLNGTRIYTTGTFEPNATLEFYARFTLGNFQNIGFAKNGNLDPFWLVIGRGEAPSDPNLYVRSSEGLNLSLGRNLLDYYHTYKIDWEADKFLVYVDGILKATVAKTYTSPLLLMVSDYEFDQTALSVDWIRSSGKIYPNTGVYQSKVFSLGAGPATLTVNWNSTLPPNTAVTISVRSGNISSPGDFGWTPFVQVNNHQSIDLGKKYLQYQAVLSTTNTKITPLLHDISFNCGTVEPVDITPPEISFVRSSIINEGRASISWLTDEPASGQIEFGTDPGNLKPGPESESEAFPSIIHYTTLSELIEGTTYYYRVTSRDAAHNSTSFPIASEPPLQFTYPFLSDVCAREQFNSFGAGGTGVNTEIVYEGIFVPEGSIRLIKTDNSVTEEFTSTTIPGGWNAGTWNSGGTTTYAGGIAILNGTHLYTTEKFHPGASITFSAKFSLGNYENIGFAQNGNFDPYWIVIGRGQLGADPNLYVRTSEGVNISLGSNLLDHYHTYRITWNNTNFTIEVDNVTTTITKTFTLPMLVQISDYNNDGTSLSIDWIKNGLPSFPASGTFISRVFSLGSTPDFATVGWNRNSPSVDLSGNTALFISVRSGNTATPDGSWTEFQEVTQNQLFKPIGSYLQYKAVLTSKDQRSTPSLFEINFTCSGSQPGNAKTYTLSPAQQSILKASQTFALEQNRPNPFNNTTIISYSVPTSGRVMLAIYDLQGRVVKTVENAYRVPGKYSVTVDTRNMGKGVYIYRIQAGEFSSVKKMIVE